MVCTSRRKLTPKISLGVLIHFIGLIQNLVCGYEPYPKMVSNLVTSGQSRAFDPETEYNVEDIIGHNYFDGKLYMLVKWVSVDEPSYTAVENLSCAATFATYWTSSR